MENTEAPASLNFRLMYKEVELQITNRDLDVKVQPYLERAKIAIDWALTNGFTAPPPRGFGKKEVKPVVYADHQCPICSSKVIIAETSKGKMEKCETQKYDFKTKTSSGCAYVKWL